ncbi:unnamed protein product, partial [Brenthis ino]
MNSKKHKSKNRAKPPPKAAPDLQEDAKAENLDNLAQKDSNIQQQTEIIKEEQKTESMEPNSEIKDADKEEKVICEVPKKPKRKKGKKKQDTWSEEKEIVLPDDSNQKEKLNEQNSENKKEQIITLVPIRKKKNKSEKIEIDTQEPLLRDSINTSEPNIMPETKHDTDKNVDQIKEPNLLEPQLKETTLPKKKKKKKNHHDSVKSDVNDACTLAFQKLLEPTNTANQNDDTVEVSTLDCFIDDAKNIEVSAIDYEDESLKRKKKHKKNKNPPLNLESNVETVSKSQEVNIITSPELIKSDVTLESTSPKPKAKIAKPVQKKRKSKSDFQHVEQLPDPRADESETVESIINKPENIIIKLIEEKDLKDVTNVATSLVKDENIEDKKIIAPLSTPDMTVLHDDIVTGNLKDNSKASSTTTEIKSDIKEPQLIETNKESDNQGFVEVKTGKNKKKRLRSNEPIPHDVKNTTIQTDQLKEKKQNIRHEEEKDEIFYDIPQLDIEESTKPEELEGLKVGTPDLIQYPRSTSQLNIDNNNNTLIQEITITDEIKLGIPIYMPTPIIEGSGETPDIKLTGEPITIKVQSMPNKDNTEKTDIKSKMFEVNKEMEELRRSIERSLAELTGTEKCDSKVDSEFEELFQSQVNEQPPSIPQNARSVDDAKNNIQESENKNLKETNAAIVGTPSENTAKVQSNKCEVESSPPICPVRSKSKGKFKRKGKKDALPASSINTPESQKQGSSGSYQESKTKESKSAEKSEQNTSKGSSQEKGKQQSSHTKDSGETSKKLSLDLSFEPIENFEDALTSSADDVNKTFEIIASEATLVTKDMQYQSTPQINVIAPSEDGDEDMKKDSKTQNPMSQPKNLLGHPNIPVSSNKNDYKKEKNKPPNSIQAKVKIKDSIEIEMPEKQNNPQIKKLTKDTNGHDAYSYVSNENEDFVYKYSFRKVFLQSACHVCKKDLIQKMPCKFCSLVFYCSQKHKDEDWPKHQSLCFAVSTIAHLKEQKFIYGDAQNITGQEYRVLRMQMILSCEKILKRKLVPWEQEALLYPRICGDIGCREWKQSRLKDCEGCGQISYCADHPEHLPSAHKQWCKSYALYQKLVNYQQTRGRLEPKLPTKVLSHYRIPDNLNQILGSMYEEKIDMDDIQYAALTQIATAPLTTAYCYQLYMNKNSTNANGLSKKSTFTIHTIATDLQFEADSLNKWEIFFLHLLDVQDLRLVLIGPELNSSDLPWDILGKIRVCENCKTNRRRVIFDFRDKQSYQDYYSSDDFITPDIVCAFNPNIQRASTYKVEDTWPSTLNCVLKQRVPFLITSYTLNELKRDIDWIKECSKIDFNIISDLKHNPFCSVRPDRNFITDHEMPLLFKNYCFSILCGI